MKGIISAQTILKQKGYVQTKFDTPGFMNAVAEFFMRSSVKAKLLLVPVRFLDIVPNEIDEEGNVIENNDYDIFNENIDKGWSDQSQTKDGYIVWARKLSDSMYPHDFEAFQNMYNQGLIACRIIIDKPYFENAAFMLRSMGGYTVEKTTKSRRKLYTVTLV